MKGWKEKDQREARIFGAVKETVEKVEEAVATVTRYTPMVSVATIQVDKGKEIMRDVEKEKLPERNQKNKSRTKGTPTHLSCSVSTQSHVWLTLP